MLTLQGYQPTYIYIHVFFEFVNVFLADVNICFLLIESSWKRTYTFLSKFSSGI